MEEKPFSERKICVVGAGVTGLATTKYLLEHGFKPVVFETKDGVGGVWQQTFSSTRLQSPRIIYEFHDFPWPSSVTAMDPTSAEVLNYLESYAKNFGLLDYIHFNTKVATIQHLNGGTAFGIESSGLWGRNGGAFAEGAVWEVGVQKVGNLAEKSENTEWHYFDFVVLCIGKYGDLPKTLEFPPNKGPEVFQKTVIHSMDYSALKKNAQSDLIRGKKVVIIGIMKSAMDLAVECAETNPDGPPCTMVFKRTQWNASTFFAWGVPFACLIDDTRLAQIIIGKPGKGIWQQLVWHLLTPMRWAISKFVELYLLWTHPLQKYGLVPESSFLESICSCHFAIIPKEFFSKAHAGLIQFRKTEKWHFTPRGISLNDGTELEADVVITCTGFDVHQKMTSMLSQPLVNILQKSTDLLPLYRGVIHPQIPHMAILGYSESSSNLASSEMRARWLAYFLSGKFMIPSIKDMEDDIDKYNHHMKRISRFYWKCSHSAYHIWQNDDICRDMGWNPHRKSNWLTELLSPYTLHDYQNKN